MTDKPKPKNYTIPNSYQTPNIYIDVLLPLLTDSEWRVLSFAMRHILGWREKIKARKGVISLSMFENGYGPYPGCGLNKQTIIKTLKSLVEHNIMEKDTKTRDGTKWYLVEDYDDMQIEALEIRFANKQSKDKKRTENMLKRLKLKRAKLLCDNTSDVLCDNTSDVLCDNTESNSLLNTSSNTKDLSPPKNSGDAVAADMDTSKCNECGTTELGADGLITDGFEELAICGKCRKLDADMDDGIELGSDGRLTEASWQKIEAMDPTDHQSLEQHALDGEWTKATWFHSHDAKPNCDECGGEFIISGLGGTYYHNNDNTCRFCPGCWLAKFGSRTTPALTAEQAEVLTRIIKNRGATQTQVGHFPELEQMKYAHKSLYHDAKKGHFWTITDTGRAALGAYQLLRKEQQIEPLQNEQQLDSEGCESQQVEAVEPPAPPKPGDGGQATIAKVKKPRARSTKQLARDEKLKALFDAMVEALKMDATKITKPREKSLNISVSQLLKVGANPYEMAWLAYWCSKKFDGKYTEHAMVKHYATFANSEDAKRALDTHNNPPPEQAQPPDDVDDGSAPTEEQKAEAEKLMQELLNR